MGESTKALASLKHAANYAKLAMHDEGPRSFKRGQGALLKVIRKFGTQDSISKDEAKRILGWRGCEVRDVARVAAGNGYVRIEDGEAESTYSLTDKGAKIVEKRLGAEDRAADAVMGGLSDEELSQLVSICDKISKNCEDLGVEYSRIRKKEKKHGKRRQGGGKGDCGHGPEHGHEHCCKRGHGAKCVIVIK